MRSNKKNSFDFETALLSIDRIKAEAIIKKRRSDKTIFEIIDEIISPALERIGDKWANGEVALAQEYMASKIVEELTDEMLPNDSPERISMPIIGITTLEDHHMLGKRILSSLVRSNGYNLVDYDPIKMDKIGERLRTDQVDILLISALMLNHALAIKELTDFIKKEQLKTKVIVGGAPFLFDEKLWKEVGADAMSTTANEAIRYIHEMLRDKK